MTHSSEQREHAVPRDQTAPSEPPDDRFHRALLDDVHPPTWTNPKSKDKYNLVIIGAGPGGVTAAREAAALGAKVALIERNFIGGDRLNVGCIPSKAIIRTARLYAEMRNAGNVGAQVPDDIALGFPVSMCISAKRALPGPIRSRWPAANCDFERRSLPPVRGH
jgi:choline dehydrogenase-like flavoprotein